jgi:hypothetical protein
MKDVLTKKEALVCFHRMGANHQQLLKEWFKLTFNKKYRESWLDPHWLCHDTYIEILDTRSVGRCAYCGEKVKAGDDHAYTDAKCRWVCGLCNVGWDEYLPVKAAIKGLFFRVVTLKW